VGILEQNIRGLCDKNGISFTDFLADLNVDNVSELSVLDLEAISEEYDVDMEALLFKPVFLENSLKDKLAHIKLLVLDVDGVMTDGGMYFSENGDQTKKFNTKDGMAIIHLTKNEFQVAIISSGFRGEAVTARAEVLGIQNCTVNREPKKQRLEALCSKLNINFKNVAILGDDVNDLELIKEVGFSACPRDAVPVIKMNVDVILGNKGGQGCIREFIDKYLLEEPLANG